MSVAFPPLPSYLPPDLPPLAPLTADATRWKRQARDEAKARGEQPATAARAVRERIEAARRARAEAVAVRPVPAPDGVWLAAVDLGADEVWWALRPLGGGQVEVWDGRTPPVTRRVTGLRPHRVRRSRLRVDLADDLPRDFRLGRTRGALTDVGMPAERWWSGGSNDPLTGVILVVAGLGALVTFPRRIARARERAATRNALAAALRG